MGIGDRSYSAAVDESGTAKVEIRTHSRARDWVVSQVSIEMPGAPIGAACTLRKNGVMVTPMVATADTAAGDPPVILHGGTDVLSVVWTGCNPDDVGTVLVFYDDSGS